MAVELDRFLKPNTIAVYGGGWAENVIEQLIKSDFDGLIWPVHPTKAKIAGIASYRGTHDLPSSPDAAFIGVNRELSIRIVSELASCGAGGAICFASGFSEADQHSTSIGSSLQSQLIEAAGTMPFLGPNCYGYLNYLDNVTLWPDQHGGQKQDAGVAIIAQSSNVAINMTMQQRGLPLAYMFTVGNQASISLSDLAQYAIADDRVTTIGLFIEGFGDLRAFESMAEKAKRAGKAIVALKLGKSIKAQQATMSHTATLAGGAAASSAMLQRLEIVEVDTLASFIETLNLLHVVGPLTGSKLSSVSCSGGEASLVADAAHGSILEFPDLSVRQQTELENVLGSKVSLANPLDYHTYIWGDVPTMTACFNAVMSGDFDINVFVLDIPRSDLCQDLGHRCAIEAIINAKRQTNAVVAVVASMPENINEDITAEFHHAGIAVIHGLEVAIQAIVAAVNAGEFQARDSAYQAVYLAKASAVNKSHVSQLGNALVSEAQAKAALSDYGLKVPATIEFRSKAQLLAQSKIMEYPLVLKGLGLAHKSESNAVILNIQDSQNLSIAIDAMPECPEGYTVESMISDALAELIIGVTRDDTGLLLMTLGAGGVLTELLADSASLIMPTDEDALIKALDSLKISALLKGYRGKPAAEQSAIIDAILAIQRYALDQADDLIELDINPLIVREHDCIAVDALIRLDRDN